MKNYRSSIPTTAQERIASIHESNGRKKSVEYLLDGEVVGYRWFDQDGVMGTETPIRNDMIHGNHYYFDDSDGRLRVTFAQPYRKGLAHGAVKQWSAYNGKLIGTYTMSRGCGWDLWRCETYSGRSIYLSEARQLRAGKWHGFEWWFDEDKMTIHQEAHFWEDLQHGIRRMWNHEGKLKRGYPQYWVNNERVSKRQYLSACTRDPNLPSFREIDNSPKRKFPLEVRAAIKQTASL
jgi:hypothetical protein